MTCTPETGRRGRLAGGAAVLGLCLATAAPAQAPPGLDAIRADLARGDGVAAEMRLREVIASGAARDDIAALMGEAQLDLGHLDKAREWLAPRRFAPADAVRGWRALARLERAGGNLAAAGAAYDAALALAPDDSGLWIDIGRLRYAGGEQWQAVDAAQRAIDADPANVRALEFRAELLRDQAGFAAALPWYERAIGLAPDDLGLLGGYAATLGDMGRAQDMLVVTRRMLELDPGNAQALFLQTVLAARAGKLDLARSLLARVRGMEGVPAFMLLQGALELAAGNAKYAAGVLDRLVLRQPANLRARALLARALYDAGEYGALQAQFSGWASRSDAPVWLLVLLARAHEEAGNRAAAAPLLDRAAQRNDALLTPIAEGASLDVLLIGWRDAPGTLAAGLPLVRTLLDQGYGSDARNVAEAVRAAHPGTADAQALAGDVQLALGYGALALERYQLAARVRVSDALLMRVGAALDQAERSAEVPLAVARYLEQDPRSYRAARLSASQWARAREFAHTAAILRGLTGRGGARDALLQSDLAVAGIHGGDPAGALVAAQRAYRLQPLRPAAVVAYALVLTRSDPASPVLPALKAKAAALGIDAGEFAVLAAGPPKG